MEQGGVCSGLATNAQLPGVLDRPEGVTVFGPLRLGRCDDATVWGSGDLPVPPQAAVRKERGVEGWGGLRERERGGRDTHRPSLIAIWEARPIWTQDERGLRASCDSDWPASARTRKRARARTTVASASPRPHKLTPRLRPSHPPIHTPRGSYNAIGPHGVAALASSLRRLVGLRRLDLE